MTKHHPGNERIKRRYVQFLKDAKGRTKHPLMPLRKQSRALKSIPSGAISENSTSIRRARSRRT
jgi:hypothetical protein